MDYFLTMFMLETYPCVLFFIIPWLQWFEPCVSFYYYMARKETRWYHGIKQILTAQYSGDGLIYCPSVLWRPLLFSLGPLARGKIVAVSRAPRGNSFNHLPHEQSIFVYYFPDSRRSCHSCQIWNSIAYFPHFTVWYGLLSSFIHIKLDTKYQLSKVTHWRPCSQRWPTSVPRTMEDQPTRGVPTPSPPIHTIQDKLDVSYYPTPVVIRFVQIDP